MQVPWDQVFRYVDHEYEQNICIQKFWVKGSKLFWEAIEVGLLQPRTLKGILLTR